VSVGSSARGPLVAVAVAAALASTLAVPAPVGAATMWLCRPGAAGDPCARDLSTTLVTPAMRPVGRETPRAARPRTIDCFYVYPTVSTEPRPQASKAIRPELRSIALYHAARFSSVCRVWAPVYRQITLQGLRNPLSVTEAMRRTALADVREAFAAYLARHNRGRGFVLIGHSQGTYVLRQLIARDVDRRPAVRRRLVSALLIGGNVLVRNRHDVGGDFRTIRACRAPTQLGCVIAYSAFSGPVPADALFGRVVAGGALPTGAPARASEVLCTNPASLGGGSGRLDSILAIEPSADGTAQAQAVGLTIPPGLTTTWLRAPGAYVARCSRADRAHVLQVTPRAGAPVLRALPDARWGLHLADVPIALGTLVDIVRRQAGAYARRARTPTGAAAPR
jgi:hypothetical protein